jgi:hypothetical protein
LEGCVVVEGTPASDAGGRAIMKVIRDPGFKMIDKNDPK